MRFFTKKCLNQRPSMYIPCSCSITKMTIQRISIVSGSDLEWVSTIPGMRLILLKHQQVLTNFSNYVTKMQQLNGWEFGVPPERGHRKLNKYLDVLFVGSVIQEVSRRTKNSWRTLILCLVRIWNSSKQVRWISYPPLPLSQKKARSYKPIPGLGEINDMVSTINFFVVFGGVAKEDPRWRFRIRRRTGIHQQIKESKLHREGSRLYSSAGTMEKKVNNKGGQGRDNWIYFKDIIQIGMECAQSGSYKRKFWR